MDIKELLKSAYLLQLKDGSFTIKSLSKLIKRSYSRTFSILKELQGKNYVKILEKRNKGETKYIVSENGRKRLKVILTAGTYDIIHTGHLKTLEEAKKRAELLLTKDLRHKLREVADYITIGVDSFKGIVSMTSNYISKPHIELALLFDLKRDKWHWTGKSYPTSNQQRGLVRIADLRTHFLKLDIGTVMILGCHDLSVFNPRSRSAKGWRKKANREFKKLARKERPICVLQHPHTAVKVRTWLNAWSNLRRTLPSVRSYASAGRYHEPNRDPSEYDDLIHVLKSTKCGGAIDLIAYL